jgi:hypothetical protein
VNFGFKQGAEHAAIIPSLRDQGVRLMRRIG